MKYFNFVEECRKSAKISSFDNANQPPKEQRKGSFWGTFVTSVATQWQAAYRTFTDEIDELRKRNDHLSKELNRANARIAALEKGSSTLRLENLVREDVRIPRPAADSLIEAMTLENGS